MGKSNAVIRHVCRGDLPPDGAGMSDGQLLGRFVAERDETAFEVLMRRHGPMVLGVCRRVLTDAHDVEDAFQATFLVLVRKAASISRREQVGNWLYGAAYRAALQARAARRRIRERQVSPMPEPTAPEKPSWEDLRPLLDQELSRLPEKFRVPVVLCDLEGRTRKEVAEQLNIAEGTLSGRLTTARRRLARRLSRQGVVVSGAGLADVLSESPVSPSIPAPLMSSSLAAVAAVAANPVVGTGVVSAKVAALTEAVTKSMFLTKLKAVTVAVAAATLLGGSGTLLVYRALGNEQRVSGPPGSDQPVSGRAGFPAITPIAAPGPQTCGYLGVLLVDDKGPNRVLFLDVFPVSPAARAGVKRGDVLLKVGDREVHKANEAAGMLHTRKPGDTVTIVIKRDSEELSLTITLGIWPPAPQPPGTENKEGT
jgi:RNA polymerase sigma factor (sigma-70 family)